MQFDDGKRSFMRVLIRRQNTEYYLQPDGGWGLNRKHARSFISSIVAYYWAKEQRLLNAEIVLSFRDPQFDMRVLRLGPAD
jgi:hypothetical protein